MPIDEHHLIGLWVVPTRPLRPRSWLRCKRETVLACRGRLFSAQFVSERLCKQDVSRSIISASFALGGYRQPLASSVCRPFSSHFGWERDKGAIGCPVPAQDTRRRADQPRPLDKEGESDRRRRFVSSAVMTHCTRRAEPPLHNVPRSYDSWPRCCSTATDGRCSWYPLLPMSF